MINNYFYYIIISDGRLYSNNFKRRKKIILDPTIISSDRCNNYGRPGKSNVFP